ncbi:MAG: glycosyltransferase family 39 protein [Phycisphaeraceae bacterium]
MAKSEIRNPSWYHALAAALLILAAYLFIAAQSTLWDRDEPRFAQATLEMIESGDYMVPTFEGELRPDKPVGIYWLMALAVSVLGPTELAFRLFTCVGAAGACFNTYLIGRRLIDARTGLWAMAIMASTLTLSVIGTFATADGVLLFFTSGAMAVFIHAITDRWRWWHGLLMGLMLGGALLIKGPPGLLPVVAMLTIAAAALRQMRWASLALHLAIALCIGIAIFLAWAIPANLATGGEFARRGLGHHVINRMVSPAEGHGRNYLPLLPFYFIAVIIGFFPWMLHLPGGVSALLGGRLRIGGGHKPGHASPLAWPGSPRGEGAATSLRLILLAWIIPIFLVMTLIVTKLAHYILPIWPALAVLAAATIGAKERNELSDWDRRWLRGGVWFFTPVAIALAGGIAIVPPLIDFPVLRWLGPVFGLMLLIWALALTMLQLKERVHASAMLALGGAAVFGIVLWGAVVPQVEPLIKLSPAIARIIHAHSSPTTEVRQHGYAEPSLTFYARRGPVQDLATAQDIRTWSQRHEPGVLVIDKARLEQIQGRDGPLSLTTLGTVQGINTNARGKPVEVVVMSRSSGH